MLIFIPDPKESQLVRPMRELNINIINLILDQSENCILNMKAAY